MIAAAILEVYPRVCGGTFRSISSPSAVGGLSPRVRGNRLGQGLWCPPERSIPACAGEPYIRSPIIGWSPVYPRVCGGTIRPCWHCVRWRGLSPRVRGNPPACAQYAAPPGSIPACAGEPLYPRRRHRTPPVYPRVCGGTLTRIWTTVLWRGLSPRVRGNPGASWTKWMWGGSIPACAGEPAGMAGDEAAEEVYPRVCGGTPVRIASCTS